MFLNTEYLEMLTKSNIVEARLGFKRRVSFSTAPSCLHGIKLSLIEESRVVTCALLIRHKSIIGQELPAYSMIVPDC